MNGTCESNDKKYLNHINNFTFSYISQVKEITKPIYSLLGIDFFCFHRLYDDGNLFVLHTNQPWVEYYSKNNFSTQLFNALNSFKANNNSLKFIFWDHWKTEGKEKPIFNKIKRDAINEFLFGHGLMFIKKGINYTDFFDFAADVKKNEVFSIYMKYFCYIEKYCDYFSFFISDMLKKNTHYAINTNNSFFDTNAIVLDSNLASFQNDTKKIFITPPSESLFLSRRQKEVALQLLLGRTSKSIALNLNLSPRTIESYIETIKYKFNSNSRNKLQKDLLKIKELRDLLIQFIIEESFEN